MAYKTAIYCPDCKKEFEGEVWEPDKCPYCNRLYGWHEEVSEDYKDAWPTVDWENKWIKD